MSKNLESQRRKDSVAGNLAEGNRTEIGRQGKENLTNDSRQSNSFKVNAAAGTASLGGFVYDQQSSAPLADVTVTLASGTLGTFTQATSSNGYYSFAGLAQGAYTSSPLPRTAHRRSARYFPAAGVLLQKTWPEPSRLRRPGWGVKFTTLRFFQTGPAAWANISLLVIFAPGAAGRRGNVPPGVL